MATQTNERRIVVAAMSLSFAASTLRWRVLFHIAVILSLWLPHLAAGITSVSSATQRARPPSSASSQLQKLAEDMRQALHFGSPQASADDVDRQPAVVGFEDGIGDDNSLLVSVSTGHNDDNDSGGDVSVLEMLQRKHRSSNANNNLHANDDANSLDNGRPEGARSSAVVLDSTDNLRSSLLGMLERRGKSSTGSTGGKLQALAAKLQQSSASWDDASSIS